MSPVRPRFSDGGDSSQRPPSQSDEGRPCSSASISSTATTTSQSMNFQPCFYPNSLAIRHEIHRFESVHPSIYAIYDLLELIGGTDGAMIAQRMREHVVCIEDSFVNSQEWTLSRAVPDLRLGVVGSITSGKSALVHRYLTGSYLHDESPEGGRFKKEVIVNDQSYLLLIRDEGGAPEMQLSGWVDAVLFVFSLEDESSFNAVSTYYHRMIHLRSNNDNIPVFLVGTQEGISEVTPRVISESRARKLCSEMKRCTYYETCATNGLHVDDVFDDACKQIVMMRNLENTPSGNGNSSRPSTPNHTGVYRSMSNNASTTPAPSTPTTPLGNITNSSKFRTFKNSPINTVSSTCGPFSTPEHQSTVPTAAGMSGMSNEVELRPKVEQKQTNSSNSSPIRNSLPLVTSSSSTTITSFVNNNNNNSTTTNNNTIIKPAIAAKPRLHTPITAVTSNVFHTPVKANSPAPVAPKRSESIKLSTENNQFKVPFQSLVEQPSKELPKEQTTPLQTPNTSRKNRRKSNLFSGTPLSGKSKNADDKYKNGEVGVGRAIPIKQGYLYKKSKKTLNKDWKKKYVTLIDGCITYHRTLHEYMNNVNGKNIPLKHTTVKIPGQKPRCGRAMVAAAAARSPGHLEQTVDGAKMVPSTNPKYDLSVKKRSRKGKSLGAGKNGDNGDDSDGNEFVIVSLDNKQWHFNATNGDEREEWVCAIEQQILSSLQNSQCDKTKLHNVNSVDESTIHSIRTVPGNRYCVDCNAPNPDWASLNLGTLICIECSGIHRNLGTHISKVRSLSLDVWPSSHASVMLGLGNTAANRIWEYQLSGGVKPSATTSNAEKERYIRAKYETKQFLAPLKDSRPIDQQIIDCVQEMDLQKLALVLAHMSLKKISLASVRSREDKSPLHLAASRGCLEITQLLLWNNVDEKAVDAKGKSALFYARTSGHKEIEELLIQSGCVPSHSDAVGSSGKGSQPTSPTSSTALGSALKPREAIPTPLNVRQIELFHKLPASII